MAATTEQAPDRIEMVEQLNAPSIEVEENAVSVESLKEQPKDEKLVSSDVARDAHASAVDLSREAPSQLGSLDVGGNQNAVYPPNIYAPQAQTFFYGGYGNTNAEWEGYPQFLNVESIDIAQSDVYNENSSLMFPTGYGYSPQMPYGPYSPVTTPLPNACGDGQLYSPQHFPFTGHYYQQPASPSMPYLTSQTPISQVDQTVPVDHQGAFFGGNSNSNGMLFGPRPGQGFDGFGSSGFWSDWSKNPDGTGSLTQLSSPAASPQPIGAVNSFGQSTMPLASGMASQQQRSLYGYGSLFGSYGRGYSHGGMYQGSNFGGPIPSLGPNGRNVFSTDKSRRGRGNASLCSCNGVPAFLSEQNRGPRATRPKNSTTEQNSSLDDKSEKSGVGPKHELYNKPDFITEYDDAKFFIIKSYSEDNVHKSIKYGVWASTINGNKKLDGAYREAKEKEDPCPVFLFFSVNASAQFCGIAEMIGAVDFEKSVDYWQQDKWTGQFPVKWHIVKDVPNNLFRHIILENNDNKPVTNSRDTQEVKLEQGLEMLSIFKKHESDISILDDFDFYEERQKAMQERKARQQQQQESNSRVLVPAAISNEQRILLSNSGDFRNQFSKSFADAVRLDESQPAAKNIPSTAAEETEAVEKSVTSSVVQSS